MIEISIKEYFDGHLDVPSFFEKPSSPPEKYVLIERTGGKKKDYLKSSVFAFQSYAGSLFEASSLNEKVKECVEGLESLDVVVGIHLNSDYNFTDTETKKYRYQAVFDIHHY